MSPRFAHAQDSPRRPGNLGPLGAAILLASSLVFGACGGESANAGDSAAPAAGTAQSMPANACVVLPASDVTAVLGEPVRDSVALLKTEDDRILSQCNYASASTPVAVSLMIRRAAPGETVPVVSKGVRDAMTQAGATVEDVTGLGEVAFFSMNQLHVFTNNGWYLIATPTESGGVPQARAMIEKAMARLQA